MYVIAYQLVPVTTYVVVTKMFVDVLMRVPVMMCADATKTYVLVFQPVHAMTSVVVIRISVPV